MKAIYRNRLALIMDDGESMTGPLLDHGDGLTFRVTWDDPRLIVDPTDDEVQDAAPMLPRLRGVRTARDGTGYVTRNLDAYYRSEQDRDPYRT